MQKIKEAYWMTQAAKSDIDVNSIVLLDYKKVHPNSLIECNRIKRPLRPLQAEICNLNVKPCNNQICIFVT